MRFTLAIFLTTALLSACAARPVTSAADPIGSPPEDLTIDLTVLAQPAPRQALPHQVHLRPSRLVLFADGSLHYGVDERSRGANWLPGLTRRLNREQMAQVWSLARNLGFADPGRGEPPVNFNLIEPSAGQVTYLAGFTARDQRWAFIHTSPLEAEQDPAMVELVRALAQLAWASDLPEQPRRAGAIRQYDFGPDPYARYRR
jgi:hypothetical protein